MTTLAPFLLAACDGPQSALDASGEDARLLARLFWVMLGAAIVLWFALNGLFAYVTRINPRQLPRRYANGLVIGGGILLPTFLIGALLVWGLSLLPDQRQPGDGLTIRIRGEQWWWRVEYWPEGAEAPIVSANEVRLPVGERVGFRLDSKTVIHSFWIPSLGGKMDMFPGRETFVSLRAEEPGLFRGQCAEFCGASHAWMAFEAEALEPAEFEAWLAHEASDAVVTSGSGAELFAREGCGACHAIRGTPHVGRVGPDLTHVGSRHSLAAGRLGTSVEDFMAWISDPEALKPDAQMPAYDHLDEPELREIATYLSELE